MISICHVSFAIPGVWSHTGGSTQQICVRIAHHSHWQVSGSLHRVSQQELGLRSHPWIFEATHEWHCTSGFFWADLYLWCVICSCKTIVYGCAYACAPHLVQLKWTHCQSINRINKMRWEIVTNACNVLECFQSFLLCIWPNYQSSSKMEWNKFVIHFIKLIWDI